MSKSIVADNVKKIISDKGLKQCVIAKKCGYTSKQFSDLLNGRKLVTEGIIFNLCNGLGVTPNELFSYDETA